MNRALCYLTAGMLSLATLIVLYSRGTLYPLELAGTLAFGWIGFLMRVLPQITFDFTSTAICLVCLVLLALGIHRFCGWLYRSVQGRKALEAGESTDTPPIRPWRRRWTLAALGVVLLMFVAALSAVGVTHQVSWLATAKESLVGTSDLWWRRTEALNDLQFTTMGVHSYHDVHRKLPPGATTDKDGNALHSWMTVFLPYASISTLEIDMDRPWDDPHNQPVFKRVLFLYHYPGSDVVRNEQGYALSHYASNVHVMGGSKSLTFSEITAGNGTSNTLLIGQVADNHMPWGQPGNWREPALGINKSPHGFGNPARTGALVAFADGHVTFLPSNTSLEAMKAMSRPTNDDE